MGNVHSEFHIRNIRSSSPDLPLTPEERDARTISCMQLSQRCKARDVEDFFSSVGKVSDVKNLSPWVCWPPPCTVLLLSAGR